MERDKNETAKVDDEGQERERERERERDSHMEHTYKKSK